MNDEPIKLIEWPDDLPRSLFTITQYEDQLEIRIDWTYAEAISLEKKKQNIFYEVLGVHLNND